MRTRKAILPDAQQIYDLIASYSGDGTLLPRTLPEICENVRDFVVLEDRGEIIGCGALHLYGVHLAEIRSITVAPWRQRGGGGRMLVNALLAEAKRHKVACICLFTRKPEFFSRVGFETAAARGHPRQDLQGLLRVPAIPFLRRSRNGSRRVAKVCHPGAGFQLVGEASAMTATERSEEFCLPQGFSFSALAAGIKVSGRPDLALVVAASGNNRRCTLHEESSCGGSRGRRTFGS